MSQDEISLSESDLIVHRQCPRYIVDFDLDQIPQIQTDFLIIGGGAAGLRAAIETSVYGRTLLITKDKLGESSTMHAQGGIAVAINAGDKVIYHVEDTLKAGDGLCDEAAVKVMVQEGIERVGELVSWGANFDKQDDKLAFTMEAAHRMRRIIHAKGDATGEETEGVLIKRASELENIKFMDHKFVIDLLTLDGRCFGAVLLDTKGYTLLAVTAKATILAAGGLGQIYRYTTNPDVATGDGYAMAYRAGCEMIDMEFVQFHPTTLFEKEQPSYSPSEKAPSAHSPPGKAPPTHSPIGKALPPDSPLENHPPSRSPLGKAPPPHSPFGKGPPPHSPFPKGAGGISGASRFLISEAVRGEGAILVNANGERFMKSYHKQAELAPRDVVSRAVMAEIARTNAECVFLDLRHLDPKLIERRFPTISERCSDYGIDISKDMIPVQASAHFMMGGVKTNLRAETNIRGLYACGEVACTGVHGANRLASNSLLETIVFSVRAASTAAEDMDTKLPATGLKIKHQRKREGARQADLAEIRKSLRSLMWEKVGIVRSTETLQEAMACLQEYPDLQPTTRNAFELQNMLALSRLIADSALIRRESRGAHYLSDYPDRDDIHWRRHITFQT